MTHQYLHHLISEEKLNDGCRCNCHYGGAI